MKYTIKDNNGNLICSIESTDFINDSIDYIDFKTAKTGKYNKYTCIKYNKKWLNDSVFNTSNGIIAIDKLTDSIVGYIFILEDGMIYSLYVFPEYRNKGISKELLNKAINDYNGYWLQVEKSNKLAIDIYKKQGFRIVKEDTCYSETDNKKKVPCYEMNIRR